MAWIKLSYFEMPRECSAYWQKGKKIPEVILPSHHDMLWAGKYCF